MTKKTEVPKVLVAYPDDFKRPVFFERTLNKVLSGLEDYQIQSLNDVHLFTEELFGDRVTKIEGIDESAHSKLSELTANADYAVIFWNGYEFNYLVHQALSLPIQSRIIPISTTKVRNKDAGEQYDVYIGRRSPWGNPFAIGDDGMDRKDVIEKYKKYFQSEILSDPSKKKALRSLKGKRLGCHCKPMACHGDVIADYLNSLDD
ncbi:DUF4326 domain-containing protein [Idiomarina ramblicola]|uniref:DUF4326 domain-containing protein n=1 Tax=Idiomarina ramblicola TaxID=263724 RepID=A0A432YY91_9GAMM|nr:DUF4326 domain-containing protein [Idiomarina ramblicola]RUO68350.1 hypothetical protein CWI78_09020 [Idiomarina ramblicola]